MAWYDTGTVSVTNGSTAVVGSGTDFISAKVQVGEAFYGPDGKIYEIAAIVSSTSLTLADNYLGTTQSGQTYKIVPTQSLVADLATNVSTLITDFANVRDLAGEGKFDDGTAAAPGITFNLDQDNGLYRIGANNWAMAVGGSKIVDLTSTGFSVTGNVGIGTESPSTSLDVVRSGVQPLRIQSTSGTEVAINMVNTGGNVQLEAHSGNFNIDADAVGIGTTSPSALLDVEAASPVIELTATTTTATTLGAKNNRILLTSNSTTAGAGGEIVFNTSDADTGRWGAISGHITENASGAAKGDIVFATKATSAATSLTERMRIDSSGNIGIGIAPSAWRSTESVIQLPDGVFYSGNNYSAVGQNYYIPASGGAIYEESNFATDYYQSAGTHVWRTAASGTAGNTITWSEAMRIDSSGHVLINNTAFSSLGTLVVKQTADSKGIAIIDDTESNTFFIENNGDETKFRGNTTSPITFSHSTGEVMRIDSSGNVSIGDPDNNGRKVRIYGTGDLLQLTSTNAGVAGAQLDLTHESASPADGDSVGIINFSGRDTGLNGFQAASITGKVGSVSTETGELHFGTRTNSTTYDSSKMILDASGNLLVGTPTSAGRFTVEHSSTSTPAGFFNNPNSGASGVQALGTSMPSTANNTNCYHLKSTTEGVASYYLYGNGSSSFTSDERQKKNIVTTRDGYLDDLKNLRVVDYHWNNQKDTEDKNIGLIAQEVEQVFPNLVVEHELEGAGVRKNLKGSDFTFILIKAIQEQQDLIESLTARIAALEGAN